MVGVSEVLDGLCGHSHSLQPTSLSAEEVTISPEDRRRCRQGSASCRWLCAGKNLTQSSLDAQAVLQVVETP